MLASMLPLINTHTWQHSTTPHIGNLKPLVRRPPHRFRVRASHRLLFHNIKPVFVFDGVAPAIKRRTTLLRRQRRELAAVKTKKIAEKLLLARLKCASPRAC